MNLTFMKAWLTTRFARTERGATMVEYVLILALIAILVIGVVAALGALYREHSCLWRRDHEPSGFQWIDCLDRENSVLAYARHDGDDHLVVVLNLTPVTHESYRVGAPAAGRYRVVLNTDDGRFDGTGFAVEPEIATDAEPKHGFAQSLLLRLPPLAAIVFAPVHAKKRKAATKTASRRKRT